MLLLSHSFIVTIVLREGNFHFYFIPRMGTDPTDPQNHQCRIRNQWSDRFLVPAYLHRQKPCHQYNHNQCLPCHRLLPSGWSLCCNPFPWNCWRIRRNPMQRFSVEVLSASVEPVGKRMNFPWLSRFVVWFFGRRGCHTDCDSSNCHTGNCHTAANHLFRWNFFIDGCVFS